MPRKAKPKAVVAVPVTVDEVVEATAAVQATDAAPHGYVIQLVELVNGTYHAYQGRYVKAYHPGPASMARGRCILLTVLSIDKARVYPTMEAALAEYHRVDPREPTRSDGAPNRPLTAWTVLMQPAPEPVGAGPGGYVE